MRDRPSPSGDGVSGPGDRPPAAAAHLLRTAAFGTLSTVLASLLCLVAADFAYRSGRFDFYRAETRAQNPGLAAMAERKTPLVVVLGDSFAAGLDNWPMLLRPGSDLALPGADVAVLAIAGTGPREYAQRLRTWGSALAPKVVIVGLYVGNDLWNVFDPYREQQVFRRVYYGLANHLSLLWYLNYRAARLFAPPNPAAEGGAPAAADAAAGGGRDERLADVPAHVARYARDYPTLYRDSVLVDRPFSSRQLAGVIRALEDIALRARDWGGTTLILLFPASAQVDARYYPELYDHYGFDTADRRLLTARTVQDRLLAAASSRGIAAVDLLPAFKRQQETIYFLNDDHLNGRGKRLVASIVRPAIAALLSGRALSGSGA